MRFTTGGNINCWQPLDNRISPRQALGYSHPNSPNHSVKMTLPAAITLYKQGVDIAITNQDDPNSVPPTIVGQKLDDLANLIGGFTGNRLVSATDVVNVTVPAKTEDYYIPYTVTMGVDSGKLIQLNLQSASTTQYGTVAFQVNIDNSLGNDGDSLLLDMRNFLGESQINVYPDGFDGGYDGDLLASNTLYLFTKSPNASDTTGFILTPLSTTGMRTLPNAAGATFSAGRFLMTVSQPINLPYSSHFKGQRIEVLCAGGVTVSGVNVKEGDNLVNRDSLSYNRSRLLFTSDGQHWYYTV